MAETATSLLLSLVLHPQLGAEVLGCLTRKDCLTGLRASGNCELQSHVEFFICEKILNRECIKTPAKETWDPPMEDTTSISKGEIWNWPHLKRMQLHLDASGALATLLRDSYLTADLVDFGMTPRRGLGLPLVSEEEEEHDQGSSLSALTSQRYQQEQTSRPERIMPESFIATELVLDLMSQRCRNLRSLSLACEKGACMFQCQEKVAQEDSKDGWFKSLFRSRDGGGEKRATAAPTPPFSLPSTLAHLRIDLGATDVPRWNTEGKSIKEEPRRLFPVAERLLLGLSEGKCRLQSLDIHRINPLDLIRLLELLTKLTTASSGGEVGRLEVGELVRLRIQCPAAFADEEAKNSVAPTIDYQAHLERLFAEVNRFPMLETLELEIDWFIGQKNVVRQPNGHLVVSPLKEKFEWGAKSKETEWTSDLFHASSKSDALVTAIVSSCPKLQTLDMGRWSQPSLRAVTTGYGAQLRHLKMSYCSTPNSKHAFDNPTLCEELSQCPNLKATLLMASRAFLPTLGEGCWSHLTVAEISGLQGDSQVERLLVSCPRLVELQLYGVADLTDACGAILGARRSRLKGVKICTEADGSSWKKKDENYQVTDQFLINMMVAARSLGPVESPRTTTSSRNSGYFPKLANFELSGFPRLSMEGMLWLASNYLTEVVYLELCWWTNHYLESSFEFIRSFRRVSDWTREASTAEQAASLGASATAKDQKELRAHTACPASALNSVTTVQLDAGKGFSCSVGWRAGTCNLPQEETTSNMFILFPDEILLGQAPEHDRGTDRDDLEPSNDYYMEGMTKDQVETWLLKNACFC